ncbi:MAG: hypothetical protein WBX19_08945 [Terracidiphilus sp.]
MRSFTHLALLAAIPLVATGIAAPQSQSKYEQRTLEINGHTGQAMVYEIDGKSYVDLESLARIANGSLGFRGGSIILHLPAAGAASSQSHEQHPSSPGMTNDFMKASLQVLATLKEWTHTLADEIQRGVPGSGSHLADFHKRAADQLRVATVDAKNESDEDALRLVTSHFHQVDNWNNKLAEERRRMDMAKYSMHPNSLDRDPSYQSITNCADFLATMLPSGHFQENHACR